jgi:hypothetical protein
MPSSPPPVVLKSRRATRLLVRAAAVELHDVDQRDLPAREVPYWSKLSRCDQPSPASPRRAYMNRAPRFLAFGPVACS